MKKPAPAGTGLKRQDRGGSARAGAAMSAMGRGRAGHGRTRPFVSAGAHSMGTRTAVSRAEHGRLRGLRSAVTQVGRGSFRAAVRARSQRRRPMSGARAKCGRPVARRRTGAEMGPWRRQRMQTGRRRRMMPVYRRQDREEQGRGVVRGSHGYGTAVDAARTEGDGASDGRRIRVVGTACQRGTEQGGAEKGGKALHDISSLEDGTRVIRQRETHCHHSLNSINHPQGKAS